ncbi:unnamed protein product [Protopolystoma xenopodis]|uniref:Uncharacterized protein n=1 Tax=Protopolystoma xenopodis TaxID=117903 RepID=A0A448XK68_9PLAT|nr:unnamed protein product [Protopolystoma xenopodis]
MPIFFSDPIQSNANEIKTICNSANKQAPSIITTQSGKNDMTKSSVRNAPNSYEPVELDYLPEVGPATIQNKQLPMVDAPISTSINSNTPSRCLNLENLSNFPCKRSTKSPDSDAVKSSNGKTAVRSKPLLNSSAPSEVQTCLKKRPAIGPKINEPKDSWVWDGDPVDKYVFIQPDSPPVMRSCYPSIRHRHDGIIVRERDNVLVCSGPDRSTAPHVAKVTALFSEPSRSELLYFRILLTGPHLTK